MRRYFNNGGSSFLETATKLTPVGGVGSIIKKVIKKSKEDKESRNPNPKTPTMMGTEKDLKKEERKFKLQRQFENSEGNEDRKNKLKNKLKKFEKPVGKIKLEVRPARKLED